MTKGSQIRLFVRAQTPNVEDFLTEQLFKDEMVKIEEDLTTV